MAAMSLPRLRLITRLFLGLLGMALLVLVVVGGVSRWNFERGFLGYLNELAGERMQTVQPRLVAAYAEHGSWDFLRENHRRWFGMMRPGGPHAPGNEPTEPPERMPASDLTGAVQRLGLLDAQGQWVAGFRDIDMDMFKLPIEAGGETVGWLVLAPFELVADGAERRFEQGQQRALWGLTALTLVIAAAAAWWIARALLRPVGRVAAATHQLAAGDHTTRVPVPERANLRDEVDRLAVDFNHLAMTLGRHEALRRDFMADVSHELRTPLAVLRGELEALEDGVRPLNQDAVRSLQGEVARLGELVEDLYDLALSDAGALSYRMATLDLAELLRHVARQHEPRLAQAGLDLALDLPHGPAWLRADDGRLQQLMNNLLENARRYTEAPGQVRIGLSAAAGQWRLTVEDSPPGVPEAELAQLFERFFRVEGSRNRAHGGAGLGLAICRNIVQAHDGAIRALPGALGGVCIEVLLPRPKGVSA